MNNVAKQTKKLLDMAFYSKNFFDLQILFVAYNTGKLANILSLNKKKSAMKHFSCLLCFINSYLINGTYFSYKLLHLADQMGLHLTYKH